MGGDEEHAQTGATSCWDPNICMLNQEVTHLLREHVFNTTVLNLKSIIMCHTAFRDLDVMIGSFINCT